MKCLWFLIFCMILYLISCKDNSLSTIVQDRFNSSVTTNTTNSFSYTINANQYTDNSNNDLSFLSDSLVVTLSAGNYSTGQAVILVSDETNATIYSDTIKSNETNVVVHLKTTKPRYCSINTKNLTAILAFTIVGQ